MPQFNNVTVASSEQVWESPDGQRKLYKVGITLDTGQTLVAKSYSDKLVPGFQGDIETYEKSGRNGAETFVKQAPKENPGYAPRGSGPNTPRSSYQPKDEAAIKAMWAIGQASTLMGVLIGQGEKSDKPFESFDQIEKMAGAYFRMVDRVKSADNVNSSADSGTDQVADVSGDEDPARLLKDVEDVFGSEDLWPPSK